MVDSAAEDDVRPGWDVTAERRVKELLYRLLEELQVTRAALYLEGHDGGFELITQYGFGKRDAIAAVIQEGHPLWDWIRRHRTTPAYENDVRHNASLASALEGTGGDRLLTLPLSVDGHLVGFVAARDKARRAAYGDEDMPHARAIAEALEKFFVEREFFGSAPAAAPPTPPPAAVAPTTRTTRDELDVRLVEDVASTLKAAARFPGVAAAAITVSDGRTARVSALCADELEPGQRDAIANHQSEQLEASGAHPGPTATWGWTTETGPAPERHWEAIRTVVLEQGPPLWVLASVVTAAGSPAGDAFVTLARETFDRARELHAYRKAARNLARTLLEPGESQYPLLQKHSQTVSELAQRFAAALSLGPDDEELVTVAAYLHDVGMRELEYARIYRKEHPDEADRRLYRRHPTVGARLVEGAAFPGDLSGVIRHHHERWDGAGYPDRLAGNAIPLGSRIIHLCEVFDVLTSTSSYRRAVSSDTALTAIRKEAGKQFDPSLVPVLAEVVGG